MSSPKRSPISRTISISCVPVNPLPSRCPWRRMHHRPYCFRKAATSTDRPLGPRCASPSNKTPAISWRWRALDGCGDTIPAFPKSSPMGQREPCSLTILGSNRGLATTLAELGSNGRKDTQLPLSAADSPQSYNPTIFRSVASAKGHGSALPGRTA